MVDLAHYVVVAGDETYHNTPDEANEHRIGLPIVEGPFDTFEKAMKASNEAYTGYSDGFTAVSIPSDQVPEEFEA